MSILTRFKGLIEEKLPKDPERLSLWLESQNPEVAKRFLGYASDILEPHHLGMGLDVRCWNDEGVELFCPYRWVNKNRNGHLRWGVLVSASELALQMFWQRHLLGPGDKLVVKNLRTEIIEPVKSNVILSYGLPSLHREQLLYQGRSGQTESTEMEVSLYNEKNQRLGAVVMDVSMNTTGQIASGSSGSKDV